MTRFLEDLAGRGVRIRRKDEKLAVSAPEGVLTPELADTIRAHREEVLRFLRAHEQEEARRGVRMERVDRTRPILQRSAAGGTPPGSPRPPRRSATR
ncbi:hypothetical protein WEB32_00345 [Streptomyces netropsis]|uniref:TubC N-terminal docking domain-related protein n=1 Tax=Streptomyces netropsis TaxID=55404 RepID=UPI0030D5D8D8